MNSQGIKLHLGCGRKKLHGFINVDVREEVSPDVVCDVTRINDLYNNNVELIYACHVLEHFPAKDIYYILASWHSALVPNGVLRLSVPDLRSVFDYYNLTRNIEILQTLLYGGQKDKYDFHYVGFDEKFLTDHLKRAGFVDIKRYNWIDTEHSYVDDYSQAYLPHMDKVNGKLMSLNMEARKR